VVEYQNSEYGRKKIRFVHVNNFIEFFFQIIGQLQHIEGSAVIVRICKSSLLLYPNGKILTKLNKHLKSPSSTSNARKLLFSCNLQSTKLRRLVSESHQIKQNYNTNWQTAIEEHYRTVQYRNM